MAVEGHRVIREPLREELKGEGLLDIITRLDACQD